MPEPVSLVYVTDLRFDHYDPADLFDLAYLLRSERHHVAAICLPESSGDGTRVVQELTSRTGTAPAIFQGANAVSEALNFVDAPTNLAVVGGYDAVTQALDADKSRFREKVARCFVVGGFANDYAQGRAGERIPIDPRLRDRNPERFLVTGDSRVTDTSTWGRLLTSGEGIIWLPRDISLWRYSASGMLTDGGAVCGFLLREVFAVNLQNADLDRYEAWDAPILLSALPGLLLAVQPDPFAWMRLFRVTPACVRVEAGAVSEIEMPTPHPNLYMVVAIDGGALGKLLSAGLRDRPLSV